jgi:hypothetical protein
MATAGLRMLGNGSAENIMAEVRKVSLCGASQWKQNKQQAADEGVMVLQQKKV